MFKCQEKLIEASKFDERAIPTTFFANKQVLVRDQLVLYWNVTNKEFIAELHANTNGWVGFGFSPDGELANSDLFIGWISKKKLFHKVLDSFKSKNSTKQLKTTIFL
jgi:hypothetical protein